MLNRDDELEHFKREINLCEYAVQQGYAYDERRSSPNSALLVHPDGDKVVVGCGHDGHWIYFSVRDHRDNGSVIDFIQNRRSMSLGNVRRELRGWMPGGTTARPARDTYPVRLRPVLCDLSAVREAWDTMQTVEEGRSRYLNEDRALPSALLSLRMLADRIRTDERSNVVFPHYNLDGLCGGEVKNIGFTGFLSGGAKGLWGTRPLPADTVLVIAESAIDALSWAALRTSQNVRLISTGGTLNPQQPRLIERAIKKLPTGEIVVATDNDDGGDLLAEIIEAAFTAAANPAVRLVIDRPPDRGDDWNQVLKRGVDAPAPRLS